MDSEIHVNRLFVDDLRECPEGWILARTITEAIRILATVHPQIVSLDHDITFYDGNGVRQISSKETFEPVARYIALMNPRPQVFFHTGNPVGQARMERILGMGGE
jgi:hypothetical protein